MTTTLSTLGTDDINTLSKGFFDMFGVSNHLSISYDRSGEQRGAYVHNEDPGFVELFNNLLGWNTDCTNEELGLLLNDDIDQFIEFTFCVIVVCLSSVSAKGRDEKIDSECYLSAWLSLSRGGGDSRRSGDLSPDLISLI
jgi:hypothetical protein